MLREQVVDKLVHFREAPRLSKQAAFLYTIAVNLTPLQRTILGALCRDTQHLHDASEGGAAFRRLQDIQLTLIHPRLLAKRPEARRLVAAVYPTDDQWPAQPRDLLLLSGKTRALVLLLEYLLESTEEKVVIVSSSVEAMKVLLVPYVAGLLGAGGFAFISGSGKGDYSVPKDRFNDPASGVRVLFLSLGCASGLNLQGGSRMILVDASWSYQRVVQALGRLDRDGQARETYHYSLGVVGSLDESIWLRHSAKQGLEVTLRRGELSALPEDLRAGLFSIDEPGKDSRLATSLRRSPSRFGNRLDDPLSCTCPALAALARVKEGTAHVPLFMDSSAHTPPAPMASQISASERAVPVVSALFVAAEREWLGLHAAQKLHASPLVQKIKSRRGGKVV